MRCKTSSKQDTDLLLLVILDVHYYQYTEWLVTS